MKKCCHIINDTNLGTLFAIFMYFSRHGIRIAKTSIQCTYWGCDLYLNLTSKIISWHITQPIHDCLFAIMNVCIIAVLLDIFTNKNKIHFLLYLALSCNILRGYIQLWFNTISRRIVCSTSLIFINLSRMWIPIKRQTDKMNNGLSHDK